MALPVETFFLQPNAEGTLQTQIRQLVSEGILTGRFRPGEKLPSSRKLAEHLGVSRITVTLAFTELLADDYIVARGRSGYYVSENAPEPPSFPVNAKPNRVKMIQDTAPINSEPTNSVNRSIPGRRPIQSRTDSSD